MTPSFEPAAFEPAAFEPATFERFKAAGESLGIAHVEASPLTRSSYHARQASSAATASGAGCAGTGEAQPVRQAVGQPVGQAVGQVAVGLPARAAHR